MTKRFCSLLLILAVVAAAGGCAGSPSELSSPAGENASMTPPADTPGPAAESSPSTEGVPHVEKRERIPRPAFEAPVQAGPGGPLAEPVTYAAADAVLYGSLQDMGDGAAGRFEQKDKDDKLEFTVTVEQEGFYRLDFSAKSYGGYKENPVHIDGMSIGMLVTESDDYAMCPMSNVYLAEGPHAVALTASWGWIAVLSLTVAAEEAPDGSLYNVPIALVNPDADDNALGLMSYLAMNYGKTSLAGQQSQGDWGGDHGLFGGEAQRVYEKTGKRPAVIGLDMIDYSLSRVANGSRSSEVEAAIEAWENNAIVTFCWHWNAPAPYIDGTWWRAFYTEHSEKGFFKKIMDGKDDAGYQLLLEDIDAIAEQLKRLRDAGVPVLWRPLHEASGGWFWWGTDRDSYLKLYKLMYDRLTNHHNLTNLIWLWNGQHGDWYPGDEYVDIIGEDVYAEKRSYASQSDRFLRAAAYTGAPKMIVLSENGVLFDPELAVRDGALWGYWCVWNGEFVNTEDYTDFESLKKFYNSEYVTTHETLPDLKTYPIYVE